MKAILKNIEPAALEAKKSRNGGLDPNEYVMAASYIKACRMEKEATATKEQLKQPLLKIVNAKGGMISLLKANLYRGESVSYLYPPAVLRDEKKLRELKKLMQQPADGRATKVVKDCLICRDQAI